MSSEIGVGGDVSDGVGIQDSKACKVYLDGSASLVSCEDSNFIIFVFDKTMMEQRVAPIVQIRNCEEIFWQVGTKAGVFETSGDNVFSQTVITYKYQYGKWSRH